MEHRVNVAVTDKLVGFGINKKLVMIILAFLL